MRTAGNLPYQANKMSTDWNDDGVIDLPLNGAAAGMTSDDPANAFREWTHVWMYYCSSDSWLGRGSDVDYADPAGAGNDFSIDHRATSSCRRRGACCARTTRTRRGRRTTAPWCPTWTPRLT